jgi:hypothetical protein
VRIVSNYVNPVTPCSPFAFLDRTWNNSYLNDSVWSADFVVGSNSTLRILGDGSDIQSILLGNVNPSLELSGENFSVGSFKLWSTANPVVLLSTQKLTVRHIFLSFDGMIASSINGTVLELLPSVVGSIVSRSSLRLSNVAFNNMGSIFQNPSTILLENSTVSNIGRWRFNYVDQFVDFRCAPLPSSCSFRNIGYLLGNAINFDGVALILEENSTLQVSLILDNAPFVIKSSEEILISNAILLVDMKSLAESRPPMPRELVVALQGPIVGAFAFVDSSLSTLAPYVVDAIYSTGLLSLEFSYFLPLSARLRQDAAAIVVTFPRPMRIATPLCRALLDVTSVALFPPSVWCSQTSDVSLTISASSLPLPDGNNTISFLPGATFDEVDPSFGVLEGVLMPILLPEKPMRVVTLLVAPVKVSHCDDFVLDAASSFGTGVYALEFSWRLISVEEQARGPLPMDSTMVALATRLSRETSSRLYFSPTDLPLLINEDQIITVEVFAKSTIFNISSDAAIVSVRRSSFADLSVKLHGPTLRRHFFPKELQLSLDVSYALCTDYSTIVPNLLIDWTVSGEKSPSFSDKQVLVVPAGRLQPGNNYTIQANISMSRSAYSITLVALIVVESVPAFALRSVGFSDFNSIYNTAAIVRMELYNTLTNDGFADQSDFTFAYALKNCPGLSSTGSTSGFNPFGEGLQARSLEASNSGGSGVAAFPTIPTGFVRCKVGSVAFIPPLNGSELFINLNTSSLMEGDYEYQFYAFHQSTGRVRTRMVKFSLGITGYRIRTQTQDIFSHPYDKAILRARTAEPIDLRGLLWSWIPANDAAASIPSRFFQSVGNSSTLIVGSGILAASTEFKFVSRLVNATNGAVVSSASASIITLTPPCCGALLVSGTQNESLWSGYLVNITAENWADEDAPLAYQFSIVFQSPFSWDFEIPLSDFIEETRLLNVRIPTAPLFLHSACFRVRVKDSLGSTTIADTSLYTLLSQSNSSNSSTDSASLERLAASRRFFDLAAELQLLALVPQLLNVSSMQSLLDLTAPTIPSVQVLLSLLASSQLVGQNPGIAAEILERVLQIVPEIFNTSLNESPFSNSNERGDSTFLAALQALDATLTSNLTRNTVFQFLEQLTQVGQIRADNLDEEEQDSETTTANMTVVSKRIRRPGSGFQTRPGANTTIDGPLPVGGPLTVVRISVNASQTMNITSTSVVAVGLPETAHGQPITITAGFQTPPSETSSCVQMVGEDSQILGCETIRTSASSVECRCDTTGTKRVFLWVAMDIDHLFGDPSGSPDPFGASDSKTVLTPFAIAIISCICGVILLALIGGAIGFKYHRGRVVRAVRQVRRKVSPGTASAAPAAGSDASMSETKTTSSQVSSPLKSSYSDAESSAKSVSRPLPPPEQLPNMVEMREMASGVSLSQAMEEAPQTLS